MDRWTHQAGQLITFLIVGNIVGAEVFGQMGMALVYTLFVHAFLVDGFAEATIQRLTIDRAHLDAAFWTLTRELSTKDSVFQGARSSIDPRPWACRHP